MASFNRFFIFFLLATLAIFVERGGFLNIHGIVPNLLLILCAALIVSRERVSTLIILFCAIILSLFFVDPFWIMEFSILGTVVILLALFRKKFTGNALADIALIILVAEILFYGTLALFNSSVFSIATIAYEFIYTALIGIPAWFIGKRYF